VRLLTPSGYKDLADCAIGDEVCAWEIGTGLPIVNTILGIETVTPAHFAYVEEGKRAWVQSYDGIDTWGRTRNTPWAAGGKWYKLGALNDLGTPKLYEWAVLDPHTITPPFIVYVINGTHRLFAHQSIWANGNVTHARDLQIGDILYDDADVEFSITSIVAEAGAEWIRFHISGDSSYIADGLTLHNASRYWVGGTGNTSDNTNHWSASDGGAPGASAPTSTDNCHWTAASNTTAYTTTVDATFNCADMLFDAAPSVSGTITLTDSATLNLYGNLSLLAGMSFAANGVIWTKKASGTQTITANGVTITSISTAFRFDGAGTVQLVDTLRVAGGMLLASGTFDPNGQEVILNSTSASPLAGAFTFYKLTRIGAANTAGTLTLSTGITVTNLFTVTGAAANQSVLVSSTALGTAITITAAAVALTNVDFMDIVGAGAATWSGTRIGDCLGNSGITFTTAQANYWYTATTGTKTWSTAGNWFLGSGGTGGAGRVPLPQDSCIFNSASIGAAGTLVYADMPRAGKDITWTGVTNSPELRMNSIQPAVYGNFTLSPNMTCVAIGSGGGFFFYGRGSHTLDYAGLPLNSQVSIYAYGGSYTEQGAITTAGRFDIGVGTFNAAGHTITAYIFWDASFPQARTLNMGASTFVVTGSDALYGRVWDFNQGAFTLNAGASTVKLIDTSATAKTFRGGGKTFNNLWLSGAGSGVYNFTGSQTFSDIKISDGAKTLKFTAGTVTTAASFTGFEDNAATITSVTAATHTLTKSGGGTAKFRGATVSYSIASPAATFYAGATGTDGGNNTNWTFNNAPATATLTATDTAVGMASAGTVSIAAAADLRDLAESVASAGTVAIDAAFAAIDSEELLAQGAVQIVGALSAQDIEDQLIAAGAVLIDGELVMTDGDDTLFAAGYVWRLINDARYLKIVTSNRNVGPVKGIQL
jgi:hypothetical protein